MGNNDAGKNDRLHGVVIVNDNDIICGRGGLALKHPGNMAYRKIVSLNKELYATCLKTEKLRISKSIVAAIREINGRFLEREDGKTSQTLGEKDENGNPVTWSDITDKRAVEKTSQALREGQPKLLKKLAARQDNGVFQANEVNNTLAMNGQYNQHLGVAPQAQITPQQFAHMQALQLQQQQVAQQQVAANNFNSLQGGVQMFGHQQQQQQPPVQNTFQAQQRPSFTAQQRPSFTLASLVEGQAFNSFTSLIENGLDPSVAASMAASMNGIEPSRAGSGVSDRAGSGRGGSAHDSWGSEDPTPLPTPGDQRGFDRSDSKTSRDSWGEEDPLPLPYHEVAASGSSEDYGISKDDHKQLLRTLGIMGGGDASQNGHGGVHARPGSKRPSVRFQPDPQQRHSIFSTMSLTSHLSELSIFSDALSLDSALDAARREAEFDMLGEFDGTEMMSIGTFESPDMLPGTSNTPKPRRSILRQSNKWTTPHTAAFPPAPLNSLDPGMIFTSTLDTAPGGVNAGTDISGLLGERRKSVVAFEFDVQRRRSSRMSMCSALTDFSGVFKRDIGSVLSIQSADFRELMADIDSDDDSEGK